MSHNLLDSIFFTYELEKSFELVNIFRGDVYLQILNLLHSIKGIGGGQNQWDAKILAGIDYNWSRLSSSG